MSMVVRNCELAFRVTFVSLATVVVLPARVRQMIW
jgi:hypothetical protein